MVEPFGTFASLARTGSKTNLATIVTTVFSKLRWLPVIHTKRLHQLNALPDLCLYWTERRPKITTIVIIITTAAVAVCLLLLCLHTVNGILKLSPEEKKAEWTEDRSIKH